MENRKLKILFIPNWRVSRLKNDDATLQAPDKYVTRMPYWFFKHFKGQPTVDVLDIGPENWWRKVEHKIKFYISQPIKAFARRNRYDVVLSHGAQSGLAYELLASFVKKKPLHVMFDIGGLNGARINHFETPLIKFALRKAPVIIVHSSRQLEFYKQYYPSLYKKAHFVSFGTDFEFFEDKVKDNDIDHILLSVGYAKRDYSTLCQAWKRANVNDYKLKIVGDDSLANQYKDCPSIEFSGKIPIANLMSLTRRCAAVVVPLPEYCYSYGQMTILQSMAMGKPMIVSRTTSTRDYIDDAHGVIAVEPEDIDSMSQSIERLCTLNESELKQMGESNQAYVKSNFNETQMAEKIEEIITKYLQR
ncbi:MAG: glycosyltransferase family 4 protein [Muribaculaceae bacterium]|nr:glycosyltransferase family 4 protein [Muribaculaceae bacterium]